MGVDATILHADLDSFYASVEQLLEPSLVGVPMAVGTGVVLAASYEAKAFGVTGGMPAVTARRLCPHLRLVKGHFSEYQRRADRVMEILGDHTPKIERVSIDEAFLDVGGSTHLLGTPAAIAAEIRRRVRQEVGLPISVGVARTKHLAKIASQVAKPDGLVVVTPESELDFLHPLPVELMWGVGPVTRRRLAERGILTIGDLAGVPPASLQRILGRAAGSRLGALAWNVDGRAVDRFHRARSVSAQSALGRVIPHPDLMRRTLRHLADRVASRLRSKQRAGHTVTVRVRFVDLHAVTRSVTLPAPVSATSLIARLATELVEAVVEEHPEQRRITLLAVAISRLVPEAAIQLELPFVTAGESVRPGSDAEARRWALDCSVDEVRRRFGRAAVGFASVALHPTGVPDEFRELAERPDNRWDETYR